MKKEDSLEKIAKKLAYFNYRVILKIKNKEKIYHISEVWYDGKDKPTFWGEDTTVYTCSFKVEELKKEMENMIQALTKPVLREVKIGKDKYKLIEVG